MFLARAVGLHLTPGTADPPELQLRLGEVQVVIKRGPEGREGPSCIAVARVPLKRRPKRTGNGYVVVPDLERKVARLHLEIASNLVSLGTGSRRALSSPNPYVAFEAQSDDERTWLAESAGLHGGLRGTVNQSMKQLLPLEHRTIQMLSDRQDGLALLSEALSGPRSTGCFMNFMRLFERAFRRSGPRGLAAPLVAFLDKRFGYSAEEVRHWLRLRGSAAHADQRREFVLDADVLPYLPRLEQAAWDVLMNKLVWRDPDPGRRRAWTPQEVRFLPAEGWLLPLTTSSTSKWASLTAGASSRFGDMLPRAHVVAWACRPRLDGSRSRDRRGGLSRGVVQGLLA